MKKVFFALILSLMAVDSVCAESMDARYEQECLGIVNAPEVTVTSSYGKLKYNFDKDGQYLRKETEKKYQKEGLEMPKDFEPIGLTKVRDGFHFNMTVGHAEISHGYSCLYPQKIEIYLGFYVPTIYILKDLEKSSCLYELALRHEMTHMQIYIEALDYFLPELKKTADSLFNDVGVRVAAPDVHVPTVAQQLNDMYLNVVKDKVENWRKEVEQEQLKLDTPENYILENKLCEKVEASRGK